jgi:hypothetical protein
MLKCKISIKLFVLNCVFVFFVLYVWWHQVAVLVLCLLVSLYGDMPTYQIQHANLCSSRAESRLARLVM